MSIGSTLVAQREKQAVSLTCRYSMDILFDASIKAIDALIIEDSIVYTDVFLQERELGYIYASCSEKRNKYVKDIAISIRYINKEYNEIHIEVQHREDVGWNDKLVSVINLLIAGINNYAKKMSE